MGNSASKPKHKPFGKKMRKHNQNAKGQDHLTSQPTKPKPSFPANPALIPRKQVGSPPSKPKTTPTAAKPHTPHRTPIPPHLQKDVPPKPKVRLVGPGADTSKNTAWMGDTVPMWGPGMALAMAGEDIVPRWAKEKKEKQEKLVEGAISALPSLPRK